MEQSVVISSGKTIILKDLEGVISIPMAANIQVDSAHAENDTIGNTIKIGNAADGAQVGTATCAAADTDYPVVPTVVGPYAENAAWDLHVTPEGTVNVETQTYPATAGATQADYINIYNTEGTHYAVWIDIDAAGTVPTGALYVASDFQIEVDIVGGDSAIVVAGKVKAAIELNANWTGYDTIVDNGDGTLTLTATVGDLVTESVPKDDDDAGAGSITVANDTPGTTNGISQVYIKVSQYKN